MQQHRTHREQRWRALQTWICPTRGIFEFAGQRYETPEENVRFTQAASSATLRGASGMTSGMTPRNVAWFKPDFADAQIIEAHGAREWLDEVGARMRDCLGNGGFYQAIQAFNIDLLWAGCALIYAEKDDSTILHFDSCQIGTFCVETDRHGLLVATARRLKFTIRELVNEFGEEAVCEATRSKLATSPYEYVTVWHLCKMEEGGRFPVASYFWEENGASDKFLRKSGFEEMPFFFTCWHESTTPYGTGPGDEALPDSLQMDELERRKLQGLARLTDPPLQAPFKWKDINLEPGMITWTDGRGQLSPIFDMSSYAHAFGQLREEIITVKQRLEQTLYAAIFTSMPLDQRPRDMSATEFLERKREALQQLGPVISAYEPNVLTPLLWRVFMSLDRKGLIPKLPQALQGISLNMKMEFVSPMANALRQTSAETTRALFQDVAMMAQASQNPEILDKIDMDQMADELATGLGCPGSVIRSDEEVAQIREQRAQAQQQQQQIMMRQQAAQTSQAQAGALNQGAQAAQTLQEMAQAENGNG